MNLVKTFLLKIGYLLLSIVRVLRKAICCRRRKETELLLPMTVHQIQEESQVEHMHEFSTNWDSWPESSTSSTSCSSSSLGSNMNKAEKDVENKSFVQEDSPDDFFKDMVPQIRKQKKVFLKNESEEPQFLSNRLALDPKAVILGPDLGTIEDSPSNWEDDVKSWDSDELIKETKKAEREKRLADHQRRKLEKESRRATKQDSSNSLVVNLSDSKDKPKFS